MRRLIVGALALGSLIVLSLLAPASARVAADPSTIGVTISVEPCSFDGTASVTYKRVDGRATSGVWKVTDHADCHAPELELSIRGQLLQNGRLVKGFSPGGACASSREAFRCIHVQGKGSHAVAKGIAGTWVLRLTMTVRGPDAVRLAQRPGCVYAARSSTTTCSVDSKPLRIR